MKLESLIGTRLAVGIPGLEATDEVIDRLRRLQARSLIVFRHNFASPQQFTRMLDRFEEALGYRLVVMVDHEGGRVDRFKRGMTRFPSALTMGKTKGPSDVERQGAVEAQELARLGITVNLAPCVDVLVDGSDPVIGNRSYGSDPDRVAALSVARVRGLQANGVAACAKHFPGLGAVPLDPHKTLPTISLDQHDVERIHLKPFEATIDAGVAMVMSSHVCYPALGELVGVPATFSKRLIRDRLRRQMGFSGLILTDDMEMGAIHQFGTIGEAAVRATEAGHDILLVCWKLSAADEVFEALRKSYKENKLDQSELEESADRFANMQQHFR